MIFYNQNKPVRNECCSFDFDDIPKAKIAFYPATFADNSKRVRLKKEQSVFDVCYYEEGFYRLFPNDEHYTCEILGASIFLKDVYFIFCDNSDVPLEDIEEYEGTVICAKKFRWR